MRQLLTLVSLLLLTCTLSSQTALGQASSNSYKVQEYQFGSGSQLDGSSSHYQAQQSVGSLGVGSTSSANYSAEAGFLTPNEPFLEFVINTSSVSLGVLSSAATASGSATFYVRAYVDSGYTVQTVSNPLTSEGGAVLTALSSPTASSIGSEQFGINVVKNANFCGAGCDLGADPVKSPDTTFAYGQAASGYNTASLFKYVKGDVIAQTGTKGIGRTDFTISYIANMKPITKAGTYTMKHDLIVVATY